MKKEIKFKFLKIYIIYPLIVIIFLSFFFVLVSLIPKINLALLFTTLFLILIYLYLLGKIKSFIITDLNLVIIPCGSSISTFIYKQKVIPFKSMEIVEKLPAMQFGSALRIHYKVTKEKLHNYSFMYSQLSKPETFFKIFLKKLPKKPYCIVSEMDFFTRDITEINQ